MKKSTYYIGCFASLMGFLMYFSYIDQIRLNIGGTPGSIILPIVTFINCIAWLLYGSLRTQKDWPIIVCNIPGIILAAVTAVTGFLALG